MSNNIQKIKSDLEKALAGIPCGAGIYKKLNGLYQNMILKKLLTAINNKSETQTVAEALKDVLAENWTLIQGTVLCYTKEPDSSLTVLLCEIAAFVASEENKLAKNTQTPVGVIHMLMPTVATDSIADGYPDLAPTVENGWQDIDIKTILKTHILGHEGQYMIPTACISNYDDSVGFASINNVYFDYSKHSDDRARLNEEEINRLIEHSQLTHDVYNAKQAFETYANEQNNLLGHLRHLIAQLEYNSVQGVGSETHAGTSAYLSIFNFFSYYDSLGRNETARIPARVSKALEKIRDFASNKNTIGNIGSCLALRRDEVNTAMSGHEEILAGIGFKGETQEQLIGEAKKQLAEAKKTLLESIDHGKYTGSDNLGITLALVHHFKLTIPFNSFSDLDVLKTLSASEIIAICSDENYRDRIVQAMGSVENLVSLSNRLSPLKLQALLSCIGPQLTEKYFANGDKFAIALILLGQERRDVYWRQYKTALPGLIKNGSDFARVFSVLTGQQQAEFYTMINPVEITKTVFDLVHVLKCLDAEKRRDVFNLFKNNELSRAPRPDDFLSVELSVAQLNRLYANLGTRLDEMKSDPKDFVIQFYWAYAVEFAKVAAGPALKKYHFSRFESASSFFYTIAAPAANVGLALVVGLAMISFAIKMLTNLVRGNFSNSWDNAKLAAVSLGTTTALTLLLVATTVVASTSLITRSIATAASCLTSGKQEPELSFQP